MNDVNTDAPPSKLPQGSVIAQRYRIDGVLAEGGMGIVYRGFHLALCQPIAIKVVRPELLNNAEAIARFLNEARAVASLRNANVAQVLDVGRIRGDTLYMVLEYLEGEDLRTVLEREGAISVERAVDYILQACSAMREVHALGIVHRDLKPENLFLARLPDGRQVLKVIDFGISKRANETETRSYTQPNRSLGSPQYMSPEQISTPDNVDARADVWSLGVVLFELLSDRLPFDAHTLTATCARVLCGESESLAAHSKDVPPELVAVVERCLRKRPEDRFASVEELALALEPFAANGESFLGRRRSRLSSGPVFITDTPRDRSGEHTPAPHVESLPPAPPARRKSRSALWPVALGLGALTGALLSTVDFERHERGQAALVEPAREAAREVGEALSSGYRSVVTTLRTVPAHLDAMIHPCTTSPEWKLQSLGSGQNELDVSTGRLAAFHRELATMCTGHVPNQ